MLKIQLFCQVEATALKYNINTSPSEAITELVETNYQMKLRHKETKHLLIGIRTNSKLHLSHRTNLTIENIREVRLDKRWLKSEFVTTLTLAGLVRKKVSNTTRRTKVYLTFKFIKNV